MHADQKALDESKSQATFPTSNAYPSKTAEARVTRD